ncbi:phosphatase PAP2 family protein [Natrialbaceae archaeon A-CW2]
MTLEAVLRELVFVVGAMLLTATVVLVGPRRFARAVSDSRWRLRRMLPVVGLLATVLLIRVASGSIAIRLQFRVLGRNITPDIERIERTVFPENPVVFLQSLETEVLNSFFVFIYLYGYVFLLIFPVIAYFSLKRMDTLSSLILAFTANYAIGLVCYIFFIAYGPRNLLAIDVTPLLYEVYPQARLLTNEVNQNTNVFPSLHTSLSVTVFILAWWTRDEYPLWVPISGFLALSVVISTMYLGIHWFSDVLAGIVLAGISSYIGITYSVNDLSQIGRSIRSRLRNWTADRS